MFQIGGCSQQSYLIYKESTMTKVLRNRSCKPPSCLYAEPRERRLPETSSTHHRQTISLFLNHHHPRRPPTSLSTNNHLPKTPFDRRQPPRHRHQQRQIRRRDATSPPAGSNHIAVTMWHVNGPFRTCHDV
jgi:hypothetical protein